MRRMGILGLVAINLFGRLLEEIWPVAGFLAGARASVFVSRERGLLTKGSDVSNICIMTQTSKGCCSSDIDRVFPTELFRALSDANRIALLGHLATGSGPQTVTEASGCCPTDLSVTSRHLAVLRDAGIVEAQKRGREVYYSVRYTELSRALKEMAAAIDACCPPPETENQLEESRGNE